MFPVPTLYACVLLMAFTCFANRASAQEAPDRDSLFQIWQDDTSPDTTRMTAAAQMIAAHYLSVIPDSAIYYGKQLLDMAESSNHAFHIAMAQDIVSKAYIMTGAVEQAKQYAKAHKYWEATGNYKRLTRSYNTLGLIHSEEGEYDKALEYYNKGIAINLERQDSAATIAQRINTASVYEAQGNTLKSLEYNQIAIDLSLRYDNLRLAAIAHNNLANNYKTLSDTKNAAYHYYEALRINEDRANTWGVISVLNNLSLLYIIAKQYDKAEENLNKALELSLDNDINGTVASYSNIAVLRVNQERYDEAIDALQECLKLLEDNGIVAMMPNILLQLGSVYLEAGRYAEAERYVDRGLAKSKELGIEYHIIQGNLYKCDLLTKQGRWQEAETYALEGYERAKAAQIRSTQADYANQLVNIYKQLGRSAEALEMYETKKELDESIVNEEATRDLIRQEYQYNYERKAYQDSLANIAALEMQAADLNRRKVINRFLWAILLIVAVFAGILINRYRLIREQQKRIQEEKDKAEAANAKLLEIDQSKSRFFTNISHEFRTPLTVIAGMADQLKEDDQAKQLLKRNTAQLLHLVNQILDLRKLESGSLPVYYIQADVVQYLRYVLESFHSLAEEKGINLSFETAQPKLVLDYDAEKLLRIVSNLLSNAIKFTPGAGAVTLSLDAPAAPDSKYYHFSVKDTGVGIPEAKVPYIFDRFYQVEDSASKAGERLSRAASAPGEGTGIGLALTQELVTLMGGTIRVLSDTGKGTTFIVKLPRTNQAALEEALPVPVLASKVPSLNAPPAISGPMPGLSQSDLPRLMIVEDNPDVMEYLVTCLGGDYQLLFASDGQEGLEKAIEEVPDLVISDVMMPRMDGFDMCNRIKTDERTSHIPLILLTAKADVESRITGLQRGADAYLVKPFDQRELTAQLNNLFHLQQRLQNRYGSLRELTPSDDVAIQQEDAFITKLKEVFAAKMDDPQFGVEQLSTEMHLSRSQLGRKVKALTGKSLSIYLRSIRLAEAKMLLLQTELSIKEIAYKVGFATPAYFTTSYVKEFEETPSDTRASG